MEFAVDGHDRYRIWTWASLVFVAGGVVLAVVGLPPVDLHGPLHYAGVMDPLCGGTRATLALGRGDLSTALRYNPGVPLLAVATLAGTVRAALGVAAGRWVAVRWTKMARRAVLALLLVGVVALEVRQQLHADLLMAPGIRFV